MSKHIDLAPSDLDMTNATKLKLSQSITQASAGVAVCYGNTIQYALTNNEGDDKDMLAILTSDYAAYQQTQVFSDLNNWEVRKVAAAFPKKMKDKFAVKGKITVASLDGYNYFFWQSKKDDKYMVLRASSGMNSPMQIAALDFGNQTSCTLKSNLAVFTMPNETSDSVAKIGVLALGSTNSQTVIVGFTLDPAKFVANQTWDYGNVLQISDLGPMGINKSFSDSNPEISASWLNLGATVDSKTAKRETNIYAIIACQERDSSNAKTFAFNLLPFYAGGDVKYNIKDIDTSKMTNGVKDCTVTQTPDGSVMLQSRDKNHEHPVVCVLHPDTSVDANQGKPEFRQAKWIPLPLTSSHVSHNSPCVAFVPLSMTVGESPVPLPVCDGTEKIYPNVYLQPYIYLAFGSDSNHAPMLYTYFWGTMVGLMNYRSYTPTDDKKKKMLVNLVADTFPYPVPSASVWGRESPSGMVNWLLCNYEYLVGNDSSTDVKIAVSGSAGITFGEATTNGIGRVDDFSLSAGASLMINNSSTTHQATTFGVTSKAINPALINKPPSKDGVLSIVTEGALFCTMQVSLIQDLMIFVPRQDIMLNVKTSPLKTSVLRPDLSGVSDVGDEFSTYCYTPGNLNSYHEDAINKKMCASYKSLSSTEQALFSINGENFKHLYEMENYCTKIQDRFGSACFGANNNLSYIEFAFSEAGMKKGEFQSTTSFIESAGMFIDGSAYAGIFVGTGINFYGIGIEGNLHAGITATINSSETTTNSTSNDWGIKLSEYLNPLAPGEAYTVRMHFLKPHPLWAVEAAVFGKTEGLDTIGSSPIRIMFTVPYVSETLAKRLNTLFP